MLMGCFDYLELLDFVTAQVYLPFFFYYIHFFIVACISCYIVSYYILRRKYDIRFDFRSFSMFDLDQDNQCGKKSQDCCPHQWIMLRTEKHGIKKRRDIFSKVTNGRRKNRESVEDSFKRSIQSHKLLKGHLFKDMDRMSRRRLINRQLTLRSRKRTNDTAASNQTSPHRLNQSRTSYKTSEMLTTGHVCGNSTPWPIITRSPKVVVKFSSDLKVRRGHLGFKLQFFISEFNVIASFVHFHPFLFMMCVR